MTKQELIKNLKAYNANASSFGLKTGIIGSIAIIFSFLLMWLKPFAELINHNILLAIILISCLILYVIVSIKHEKTNDKSHSMYCTKCKTRYDSSTLAIAVLENKCQECGNKIYET